MVGVNSMWGWVLQILRAIGGYFARFIPWILVKSRSLWVWLVAFLASNLGEIWKAIRKYVGGWKAWGVGIPIAAGVAIAALATIIDSNMTVYLQQINIKEYLQFEPLGGRYHQWGQVAYYIINGDGFLYYCQKLFSATVACYVLRGSFAIARGILGSITG